METTDRQIGPGAMLAQYRVDARLGQGGMGVVYRAFDTRLHRPLALKVLAATQAMDEGARRRLLREARAASVLNHPGIVTIYDVGTGEGTDFIAMELVEGKRLDELIPPKGMPVAPLLRFAVQAADALASAHDARLLHRDIKPSNIMVTASGRIKVLDFGLARLLSPDAGGDALTRTQLTRPGAVVGTAAYMSPEQAEGRPLDARSDVFSLGCVLYEMATGTRPFQGDSELAVMHRIAREDPPPPSARVPLPPEVDALILRCLRKDPARRFQTMDDLKSALEDLQIGSGEAGALPLRRRLAARALAWSAAGLAVAALMTWSAMRTFQPPAAGGPGRTVKFSITPANLLRGGIGEIDAEVSVSRDGRHIAYVESNAGQLWIRDIDRLDARPVAGATAVYQVFWSPDSQSIGFSAGRNCGTRGGCELRRIPVHGGTPTVITRLQGPFRRAAWSSDGRTIVYCDTTGMYTVPAEGGPVTRVVEHPHIEHPSLLDLPGGRRAFLYQAAEPDELPGHGIYIQVENEPRRLLRMSASNNPYPAYSPTGHVIYVDGANDAPAIWALPFSLRALEPSGPPFRVVERGASPMVSDTGTLVYSDVPSNLFQLAWVDRSGATLSTLGEPQRQRRPILSPDGRKLAMEIVESESDLWVYDLDRDVRTRITFDPLQEQLGGWAPGGDQVTYAKPPSAGEGELVTKASSGTGEPSLLVRSPLRERNVRWSPDDRFLLSTSSTSETGFDILFRQRQGEALGEPTFLLKTRFNEQDAHFSPDGGFVAYVSDESGRDEVYVVDFPAGRNKWRISVNGGTAPRWRRDGLEIFYVDAGRVMAVPVTPGPRFAPGAPAPLFVKPSLQFYDLSADGKRFIVLEKPAGEPPLSVHVVHDWFEEFRASHPAPDR